MNIAINATLPAARFIQTSVDIRVAAKDISPDMLAADKIGNIAFNWCLYPIEMTFL